jgi:putative ABC transport system permease protein
MSHSSVIFSLSVRSIRLHILRSILAALGIVIGVIAIATMGMMGANMTLSVTDQLAAMGNILVVNPSSGSGNDGMRMPGGGGGGSEEETISTSEYKDIRRAAGQNYVYYVYSTSDSVTYGNEEGRATIMGLDPAEIPGLLTLTEGDYPKSSSNVLVGSSLVERFNLHVGSRLKIGDKDGEYGQTRVRVSGIIEERGFAMDLNTDRAIVASEKWYTARYGGEGEYDRVNIILNDIGDAASVRESVDSQLNKKEEVVNIQDSGRMLENITGTLGTLTSFVMAIAGISLVVAAVSIFNVMMMSVTERIREIGILRSIGTLKSEIRKMFMYEAIILGLVGAFLGAVLSLIIGYLVVLIMVGNTDYFFAPQSLIYIPLAMSIGFIISVVSGVYPAWRASDLDPIVALRAE